MTRFALEHLDRSQRNLLRRTLTADLTGPADRRCNEPGHVTGFLTAHPVISRGCPHRRKLRADLTGFSGSRCVKPGQMTVFPAAHPVRSRNCPHRCEPKVDLAGFSKSRCAKASQMTGPQRRIKSDRLPTYDGMDNGVGRWSGQRRESTRGAAAWVAASVDLRVADIGRHMGR